MLFATTFFRLLAGVVLLHMVVGGVPEFDVRRVYLEQGEHASGGSIPLDVSHIVNMTVVSDGYIWAENLDFAAAPSRDTGALFVSDTMDGSIHRIRMMAGNSSYVTDPWVGGLARVLGVVYPGWEPQVAYAVARLKKNETNVCISFSTAVPNQWKVVATLPDGFIGNGFRAHTEAKVLYASSEGDFFPDGGGLFRIDPFQGVVTRIEGPFWAADGLWIRGAQLLVGELFTRRIWGMNLTTGERLGWSDTFPAGLLDDFTTMESSDGRVFVIGCDWLLGRVMVTPLSFQNSSVYSAAPVFSLKMSARLAADSNTIHNPTSARFGNGMPGFEQDMLFVTEGRNWLPFLRTSRVFKIQGMRQVVEMVAKQLASA